MKIGMVFPGYGSQYIGMGKELYDNHRIIQEFFEEASNCLNVNFVKLCFAASDTELSSIDKAYLSIFLVSSSISSLLKEYEVVPSLVAGYDLGEYSAVFRAGGLSFPDGLYFINKYVSFYQEMLDNIKASVLKISGVKTKDIEKLCNEISDKNNFIQISSYNTDLENLVVAAEEIGINLFNIIKEKGEGEVEYLPIEYGLHSRIIEPVVENLKIYLPKIDFKNLTIPLVKNTDARTIFKGEAVRSAILNQAISPILWNKVMKAFSNFDLVIEVGPGSVLTKMMRLKYPELKVFSINNQIDIDNLLSFIDRYNLVGKEVSLDV